MVWINLSVSSLLVIGFTFGVIAFYALMKLADYYMTNYRDCPNCNGKGYLRVKR